MEFIIKPIDISIENLETDAIVIGVFSDKIFHKKISSFINNDIMSIINDDFDTKVGNTITFHLINEIKAKKIIFIGLGERKEYSCKIHKEVIKSLSSICMSSKIKDYISTLFIDNMQDDIRTLSKIDIISLGNFLYKYEANKNQKNFFEIDTSLKKITYLLEQKNIQEMQIGLNEGKAIVHGMNITRTLGNLPSNTCTPTYLGKVAYQLAKDFDSINTKVLEKREIEMLNMQSFLSVAKGSIEPPRLIIMTYNGTHDESDPIVIIGKGITFDSGGISIKPSNSMDEMKYDMCGAATVIGVFRSLAELKLNIKVVGIIVSCENMPSGNSNKPGDVITSMSGKTIEIINTDAEGRLILCDAITYAKQFKPCEIIDIATLTGACVVALGKINSGLFSNDNFLSNQLIDAGKKLLDPIWLLPIDEEYNEEIKSNFADLANSSGPYAGAITAACFLSNFVGNHKWAHIDIAGTAWEKGKNKGATGRPVPLIMQFLLNKSYNQDVGN